MAEKRKVVLTQLIHEHITTRYQQTFAESPSEAEVLMDDFLDVVFDEIPRFPTRFPIFEGLRAGSADYRMAKLRGGFCVIFQVLKSRVLILVLLHESELPESQ